MPYYFITGGRAVEIDEDTFDDLNEKNRSFELFHDNPNRRFADLWYRIIDRLPPGEYPDEGIMVVVDRNNNGSVRGRNI